MHIRHIDEALALIEGRKEFVVKRAANYVAIDYLVAFADSFDDIRRAELRGIKFHPDGAIMARPFHKFFNVGEREHTQPHRLDFAADHTIMDKLDGSMIHPAQLRDGSVRFMTRMGLTDTALLAERQASADLLAALAGFLAEEITPIFEFTAPDNRIVVKYEESALTLLALRHTVTGAYLDRTAVEAAALAMKVGAVRLWDPRADLIETVRALKGAEGVVVRFADGLWVKIKGEEYALMHKAKDAISREKNVLAVLLDGIADDLRPLLIDTDRVRFDEYERKLHAAMLRVAAQVERAVEAGAALDQKAFATEHLRDAPAWLRPLAFLVRGGRVTALEAVRGAWRKHCGTQAEVDALRPLLGFGWSEAGRNDGPLLRPFSPCGGEGGGEADG
jgi:RNA ligase